MQLFDRSPTARRLAVFVHHEFPLAAHEHLYAQADAIAAAVDGRWLCVHEVPANPGAVPLPLRRLCGEGIMCPQDRLQHRNDVEHLRSTLPGRFDATLDALRELAQCSRAALIVRPELQAAAGATRWLRGYAPQLIVSFGLREAASRALFASAVLDVPRVHVLDQLHGETAFALLLPLHVHQCALLLATDQAVADALRQRFGDALPPLELLRPDGTPTPAATRALQQVAAHRRAPTQPALGPQAAFVTAPPPLPARRPGSPRPLLVLGAERTGSSMLIDALHAAPGFACGGELYNGRHLQSGELDWLRGTTPAPELLTLRLASPGLLHGRLLAEGAAAGAHTVGCKLLYSHGLTDDRVVDHFAACEDLIVVHLRRRHRLRRTLSLARARRNDQWHAAHAPLRGPSPIELAPHLLAAELMLVEQLEARFAAVFEAHQPLECEYAQLVRTPQQFAKQLGARLGTAPPPLRASTHRTGGGSLTTAIHNLADLRSSFRGTRWARCFDEADEFAAAPGLAGESAS